MGKPAAPTSVEAVKHSGDHRMNIPTAELGALAEQAQNGPQMLRYPRDPSLDPQLVWKGKDEQDGEDLVVPAIPVHIQEQISPKAIVEDLALSSPPFAEPGQVEVEAALAAMSLADRLAQFWRMQEIAIARSWALVERSGLVDPRARLELLIRSRFPDWSDAEVDRLLDAISQRETYDAWLDRLHIKADQIAARL